MFAFILFVYVASLHVECIFLVLVSVMYLLIVSQPCLSIAHSS